MDSHPVVHLVSFPLNGHVLTNSHEHAFDCWCEPARIYWVTNIHGIHILIVEHNDYTAKHRHLQLQEQEAGIPEALAWINHALYEPANYPTAEGRDWPFKQLPPHEEKGPES